MDVASGRSMDRPGLRDAFAAVDSGRCDGLVASKLDRLGRSVVDVASTIDRFARGGHTLILLDVGIDTSTIMGAAMAQMASVFAEMERKRISQRTSEAMRALPRERRNGRPCFDDATRARARALRSRRHDPPRDCGRAGEGGCETCPRRPAPPRHDDRQAPDRLARPVPGSVRRWSARSSQRTSGSHVWSRNGPLQVIHRFGARRRSRVIPELRGQPPPPALLLRREVQR